MRHILIAVIVSAAGFATVLAQAPSTVLDGVYTTEQAERGHVAYERYCIQCHEGLEADGPDLTNKAFLDRWREDKLEPLFTFIKTTMPGNTPGSLDERVYADIPKDAVDEVIVVDDCSPDDTVAVDYSGRCRAGRDGFAYAPTSWPG